MVAITSGDLATPTTLVMMQTLFFITSAIHTPHGVFDPARRFEQTLASVHSVRERLPQAKLVWIEMAAQPLSAEQIICLQNEQVQLLDCTSDAMVQHFSQEFAQNHNVLKTATELRGLSLAFQYALQAGWLHSYQRVFKLSGRYTLTDDFLPSDYRHGFLQDKFVFSSPRLSQFAPEITGDRIQQYMSRLWSAGPKLYAELPTLFERMSKTFFAQLEAGRYVDMEHLLYEYAHARTICFEQVGVTGQLGPNGAHIAD